MAEVSGFLRDDATFGEKETLRLLSKNLPKEFTIYVESPIHKKRDIRYPDFIVVSNYGIIVLEVKDWVTIINANPTGATIRNRQGQERFEHNPVTKAREFALILSNELHKKIHGDGAGEGIPWSYAAVLIHQPSSTISRLRVAWGEEYVFGKDDLSIPDILLKRLRMTFPAERMRPLLKEELALVRATIFPVVEIEVEGRTPFVLDEQQEKIVSEPVKIELPAKDKSEPAEVRQETFFQTDAVNENKKELPDYGKQIGQNVAIRLVRGIAGSGKSLVLGQRAKFLAAQYPEWKIAVLTYNDALHKYFEKELKSPNVRARTFHSLCRSMTHSTDAGLSNLKIWLDANKFDFPVIRKLGVVYVEEEFGWIRDLGLLNREQYLKTERRGRGRVRVTPEELNELFTAFEDFQKHLRENNLWDWDQLPLLVLQGMDQDIYSQGTYDAILIDEAQDWAPVWFKVINRLLKPDSGLIFLADDPSQSIYRSFSWKEKGMHVVGRTRWLKVPYRNTFEIYSAAYAMIAESKAIQDALLAEGELVRPEIISEQMRHGLRPMVQKCYGEGAELSLIKNKIDVVRSQKIRDDQVAVLVRKRNRIPQIQTYLKGYDVRVQTAHSFKGLEAEVIYMPFMQDMFDSEIEQERDENERRLAYMCMSRARSQLYMSYSGRVPKQIEALRHQNLVDFIG